MSDPTGPRAAAVLSLMTAPSGRPLQPPDLRCIRPVRRGPMRQPVGAAAVVHAATPPAARSLPSAVLARLAGRGPGGA
jgi:hypothetical protein